MDADVDRLEAMHHAGPQYEATVLVGARTLELKGVLHLHPID